MAKQLSRLLSDPISIGPFTSISAEGVLSHLPSSPGIYIFADAEKTPLYIGKSIDVKNRIQQHLDNAKSSDTKTTHFVNDAVYLIIQGCDSDLTAIILESNLIKLYQPYYNSLSKDGKSLSFVSITDFPQPHIQLTRGEGEYGPYLNAISANQVLKSIRHIFGYCQNPFNSGKRSCFYYHLHQCPGACNGQLTPTQYKKHLTRIKIFLSGRFKYLLNALKKEINLLSKNQKYEQAQILKLKLESLKNSLNNKQYKNLLTLPITTNDILDTEIKALHHPLIKTAPFRIECYDLATLNQENTVGVMVVFEEGMPKKSDYRKFIVDPKLLGDPNAMASIIQRRLRHPEWPKPDLIILDGGVAQLSMVKRVIGNQIALIALSKKRETLHFYGLNGNVINLNLSFHNPLLKIFQYARDEAHRFGTTFHKSRREKSSLI